MTRRATSRLALWLCLGAPVMAGVVLLPAHSLAQAGEDEDEDGPADPNSFGKTPEALWKQVDDFFLAKEWKQTCARLDRLRELGEDLKKRKQKAGYAYIRCAAGHLKKGDLTATDNALELSRKVAGELPERKPVEADLHRALASMALEKKDLAEALAHFEIAAARNPEAKKEQEASLKLSKLARVLYDAGDAKGAKEAVNAALLYYPENRDALLLQDSLTFWTRSGWWIGGGIAFMVLLIVFWQMRRKGGGGGGNGGGGYDPYDPYAA